MVNQKKEEFMSQIEHYRAVLEDLQKQRNEYRLKINEIEQAMASLHRLIPEDAKPGLPPPAYTNGSKPQVSQANGRYGGMSVRWAILNLLSEFAIGPMTTGEIAIALRAGGITSEAANFAGNVSAVLSVMANKKGEVQTVNNGWTISPIGKQAWAHIRGKRESQQVMLSSSVQ
jgi:hypothetical protein